MARTRIRYGNEQIVTDEGLRQRLPAEVDPEAYGRQPACVARDHDKCDGDPEDRKPGGKCCLCHCHPRK